MILKECCSKCGFPLDMERSTIFLNNNILSLAEYMDDQCEECGHISDGTSIKVIKDKIDEIAREFINKRERLIKFLHYYHFLTNIQRALICVSLPRFCKPNYESRENEDSEIEEPYSWNVVYMEVINDTEFSRTMLNNIDWERIEKKCQN